MRKFFVACLVCSFSSWPTLAQVPESISNDPLVSAVADRVEIIRYDDRDVAKVSLEDILLLTIGRSLTLEASRLGETIAKQELRATQERYIDQLTTRTGVDRTTSLTNDPIQTASRAYAVGTSVDSLQFSSTFARRLRSGTSYGLTAQERRFQTRSLSLDEEAGSLNTNATGEWRDMASVRAFASIPFFQDAGTAINDLPERFAELGVQRSQANIRQAEQNQLAVVASTYWDMVAVLENVEVQKSAVELSEQLLQDNEARLEVGTLSRTDVLVADTQLSRDRQALFSARLDALRIEDQLRAVLNLSGIDFGFYPSNRPQLRQLDLDFEQLRTEAIDQDPQLQLLEVALRNNRLEVQQEENKLQTNLDLDLSYTLNGYANNPVLGAVDFIDPGLHGFQAQLTWTLPLGDQATPERLKQKRLQREQLLLNIDSRKSELEVGLQTILRDLELSEQEVSTAETVVRLASEQLQNEIERFRLGQGTSFQVSQFQQQQTQAKAQDILARVRYEKAYLRLLTLTGRIYQEFNLPSSNS